MYQPGEMPPEKKKQPERGVRGFLDDLAHDGDCPESSVIWRQITMRRLNKRDYQNSIESLLG